MHTGQSYELCLELWVLSNSEIRVLAHTVCLALKTDGSGPMSTVVMVPANLKVPSVMMLCYSASISYFPYNCTINEVKNSTYPQTLAIILIKRKIFNMALLRSAWPKVTNYNFEIPFKTYLIQHSKLLI